MKSLHDEKLFSTFCHRFPKPNASMGIMKLTVTYKILVAFVCCTICTQSIILNTPTHQYIYPSNKSFYPSQNVFPALFIGNIYCSCLNLRTKCYSGQSHFKLRQEPLQPSRPISDRIPILEGSGCPPQLWHSFDTTLVQL